MNVQTDEKLGKKYVDLFLVFSVLVIVSKLFRGESKYLKNLCLQTSDILLGTLNLNLRETWKISQLRSNTKLSPFKKFSLQSSWHFIFVCIFRLLFTVLLVQKT